MVLTSKQIRDIVRKELGHSNVFLTDTDYVVPNKYWLLNDFYRLFRKNLKQNNLYTWKKFHDCDNKSFKYWQFANDCHAMTMMLREKQGLTVYEGIAIGVLFFMQNNDFGHAINFIITKDLKMEFIEPQNGQILKLSSSEKKSSWFAIF